MLNSKYPHIPPPTEEDLLKITLTGKEFYDSLIEDVIKFIKTPDSEDFTYSKALRTKIFNQKVNNLFKAGKIKKEDLDNKTLIKKKVLGSLQKNGLNIVTTYTASVLKQAEHFHKSNEGQYAVIFYAMYFEHTINSIIQTICRKRGLNQKTINEVIRTTSINAKFTWLPQLLGLNSFNAKYLKTILDIADKRNSIIHYKWNNTIKAKDDLGSKKEKLEKEKFEKSIKLAINYMKKYESLVIYKKQKNALHKRFPIK